MEEQDNPFAAPMAELQQLEGAEDQIPAGRGTRLAAQLVQGMLLGVPLILGFALFSVFEGLGSALDSGFTSGFGDNPAGVLALLLLGVLGMGYYLLYIGMTLYLLHTRGQSIGKYLFGIQIVDHLSGGVPPLWRIVVLRYLVGWVIGMIPVLSTLYGLLDPLFIFGADHRCIHDHIAGTRVIVRPYDLKD